ncbi:MAG: hypothetical protein J6W79_03415 [Alphaproteobacteria bacterium]|nr:hypothetical protein [Alphaproteobacteria bacterium]
MIKTILFTFFSVLLIGDATAATPWWEQNEICHPSPSKCYSSMGTGYSYDYDDEDSWDTVSQCWGKKYICAAALKSPTDYERVALSRGQIADTTIVNSKDFDLSALNGDCFGVRKTTNGGTMAYVNGNPVRVWCRGILEDPDENAGLPNGEIPSPNNSGERVEPTCTQLSEMGFAAIQNGKCYGKQYNISKYRILCDANDKPSLVILNGRPWDGDDSEIVDQAAANERFEQMYNNSHPRYQANFKE